MAQLPLVPVLFFFYISRSLKFITIPLSLHVSLHVSLEARQKYISSLMLIPTGSGGAIMILGIIVGVDGPATVVLGVPVGVDGVTAVVLGVPVVVVVVV